MLFLIHFEIDPKNRDESLQRIKTTGDGFPANVKPLGIWHSTTLLEGWLIVEATDAAGLAKQMHHWTDLNVNHITPVLSEDEVLKIFS